jgi:uncharacterized membrane protein
MIGIVIGKLHPLLVHLPIGILIVAFAMELASRAKKYEYLKKSISFILGLAALSAILASFTGWIMPKAGSFDEALLGKHFWFAISLTIGIAVLFLFEKFRAHKTWGKLYFPFFILNILLLSITGHFGGSLTHGSNYLFEDENSQVIEVKDVNELLVFEEIVQPILAKKCTSCHNPQKIKGELIMTTFQGLKKGGKEGPVFISGNAKESPMIERVHLEKVEKKHMPPDGKVQLTNDEIQILTWWINEGAVFQKKVGDLEQEEKIKNILKKYETTTITQTANLKSANQSSINNLISKDIKVYPLDKAYKTLSISMAYDTLISKSKVKQLKKVGKHIKHLDLSFTRLNSEMLSSISNFENLENLNLQETLVDDEALEEIESLKYLKRINLYGTEVSDEGLESIKKLQALEQVYLWKTKVTEEGIKALVNDKPLLQVQYQLDTALFGDAKLKPPIVIFDAQIFEDTLGIELSLNFKDVNIYYTLDGSIPDTNATKYTGRFVIDKISHLKAISLKEGWQQSDIAEQVFTKAKYKIKQMKLQKPPNDKYKGNGALTLSDFEKGSTTFTDGKWLGYQNAHLIAKLDLGNVETVSSIAVGALEDTNSYIFFPKAIKVYTSNDNINFKLVATKSIPTATEPSPPEVKTFLLPFDSQNTRYLKIEIISNLKNPSWHPAPGADCWIFIDEILVN